MDEVELARLEIHARGDNAQVAVYFKQVIPHADGK